MKYTVAVIASLLVGFGAFAYDQAGFSVSTITTNVGTDARSIKGEIDTIIVTIPTAKTATVAVASAEGITLFSKAGLTSATDGAFPVRYQVYSSAGTAQTVVDAGANTNALLDRIISVGAVTVTVTPAAATTETNTYSVFINYKK
jgi:hypothetical protein